jgi:hypothetical protein
MSIKAGDCLGETSLNSFKLYIFFYGARNFETDWIYIKEKLVSKRTENFLVCATVIELGVLLPFFLHFAHGSYPGIFVRI